MDSEHADALEKIRYLESKHQRTAEEEMIVPEVPLFGHPLKSIRLDEGQPAHFETTLTPVNDATMNVRRNSTTQEEKQSYPTLLRPKRSNGYSMASLWHKATDSALLTTLDS